MARAAAPTLAESFVLTSTMRVPAIAGSLSAAVGRGTLAALLHGAARRHGAAPACGPRPTAPAPSRDPAAPRRLTLPPRARTGLWSDLLWLRASTPTRRS